MLGFIEIPEGPFTMGSDNRVDKQAYDSELPAHAVTLPAYFIGRFPVTVAQFRSHVEDTGVRPVDPDCLRSAANHPVVNVSWHEALAYCDWLARKLGEWSEIPLALARVLRPTRKGDSPWRVTLASEAEWEKAARGADRRIYPWGGPADPNKANYGDTGIGGTSAVGCFPSGVSPYEVEELSGNVSEWTRSSAGAYPYVPGNERESLKAGQKQDRIVRGGSFFYVSDSIRAARRSGRRPGYRSWDLGLRVVVSPFFSDL
jgi:formylglycine-generating enzyme required for sulfatase activity